MFEDVKIKLAKAVLYAFVLLSVNLPSFSQNYIHRTFTTSDGLPHNNVRDIIADSAGFLWIATWDGLSRYDGYDFTNYYHIPEDSLSLPYFSASMLRIDYANNLWVMTDNGMISRFNRLSNDFVRINKINGETVETVLGISTDRKGFFWFTTSRNVYRYLPDRDAFEKYTIIMNEGKNELIKERFDIQPEGDDILWIAGNTIYKFRINESSHALTLDKESKLITSELTERRVIRNYDHSFWCRIHFAPSGRKWLLTNYGLYLFKESVAEIPEFQDMPPFEDFKDQSFKCWSNINGGATLYLPERRAFFELPPDTTGFFKFGFSNQADILWFSNTSFSGNPIGLQRIIFTPDYFEHFIPATKEDPVPAVYSISKDNDDNIWLGTRGRDYITLITPDKQVIRKKTPASATQSYAGPVRSMIRTPEGIWIGYFQKLLLFYSFERKDYTDYSHGQTSYRAIALRNDGKLYTGEAGLSLFDPATRRIKDLSDTVLPGGNFRFTLDKSGKLWGGRGGCFFFNYDPAKEKIETFPVFSCQYNIEDIYPDDKDIVWLALLGGGLVRFNTETGERHAYTTSSGLSNNTVYCILKDKNGMIWISTDKGICRLNPESGIIKEFGPSEGLRLVEFNSGASFTDDNGNLYFGGMGGAICFNPDSILADRSISQDQMIMLCRLNVSGSRKILNSPLNASDTIFLNRGENNFHLTFSSTDFANSDNALYRYRFGETAGWTITDYNHRTINVTRMQPGYYRLHLQVTDRKGEWSQTKNLVIRIRPFFYQTITFKALIIVLIISMINLVILLYIRNFRQKERHKQGELRLQALRGQMNPHFIFNSLNSINYFISKNDQLSANRYIADFSRLIRTILANMGSNYVPFATEIDSIRDYLEIEHLRFGDKFDYAIDRRGIDEMDSLQVFPGLVQPFIENAIWHGVRALENRKGFIRIKIVFVSKQKLSCIVEDDGIGRDASEMMRKPAENHRSRGISIVTERLQIISKMRGTEYRLEITDLYPGRKETGTKVLIEIPAKINA